MSASTSTTPWSAIIWPQFGAAIDMLEHALRTCPDELWSDPLWSDDSLPPEGTEFWYVVYHTLFWLDLYLSGTGAGFAPPAPFTLAELEPPAGRLPERRYSKDELQTYLDHGRKKCHATLDALTDEQALHRWGFGGGEVSFAELLLYNMRHVQEHAAQLNMFLGQQGGSACGWVGQTKRNPSGE